MSRRLQELDTDTLTQICAFLDPVSLGRLTCTCRALRAATSQNQVWKRVTRDRWRLLNWRVNQSCRAVSDAAQAGQRPDSQGEVTSNMYHRLYSTNNSWDTDEFVSLQYAQEGSVYDFCVSRPSTHHELPGSNHRVYILRDRFLDVWEPGSNKALQCIPLQFNYHQAITETTAGTIAAARVESGSIDIISTLAEPELQLRATWHNPWM